MKRSLPLVLLLFISAGISAQNSLQDVLEVYNTHSVPYISVTELRVIQLKGEVIILDAREFEEFKVSRIPSARFVGYSSFSSEEISKTLTNKDAPIVVYCSLGIRSEEIGEKLKKAGYSDVQNLYGGIFEWKNKGYPVLDGDNLETENVHACNKSWSKWLKKGTKIY